MSDFDDEPGTPEEFFMALTYRIIGGRLNRTYHIEPGKSHCLDETGTRTEFRDEHRAREHLTRALKRALTVGAAKVDIQVTKG